MLIEVEQKFVLSDGSASSTIQSKLQDLGMQQRGEQFLMVDWYFDLAVPTLTPRDNWLRYRTINEAKAGGTWQLKKGQRQHEGGATVYQEIEGDEAVRETLSMIPVQSVVATTSPIMIDYEGYRIPELPGDPSSCGLLLVPFCRIETKRSSWGFPNEQHGLTVDLDATNFGYMVGEVEMVVETNEEVDAARQQIKDFLRQLIPTQEVRQPAVGKLERYLMEHRPEHYQACVEGGSIVA
jgi:adenylate cyclase class IV